MKLDINTDEIVIHANRLEKMSRTALPNAVRGTLNSLAFDVKKSTMPAQAEKSFTNRKKNFFKSKSNVQMARGSHINSMESRVGFLPTSDKNDQAVENLEQQERGGKIDKRDFVPTKEARTTKSQTRTVARRNQLRNIKGVARVSQAKGKSKGERFIKTVVHVGKKGVLLTDKNLLRVKSIKRNKDGSWKFRFDRLYSFEENRSVRVNATHFMEKATKKTMKKEIDLFRKQADRELRKLR
jgi:hypothetical protein